jgi:hypothetical protein
MLQGENWVMPLPVDGFMTNRALASHVLAVKGQHSCLVAVPSEHD